MKKNDVKRVTETKKCFLRYFIILPPLEYSERELIDIFQINTIHPPDSKLSLLMKVFHHFFTSKKEEILISNINPVHERKFVNDLDDLVNQGWLIKNNSVNGFKFSLDKTNEPYLKETLRPDANNCRMIIDYFKKKIRLDNSENLPEIRKYLPFVESIVNQLTDIDEGLRLLNFNLSSRFRDFGEIDKSIIYALKEVEICEKTNNRNESSLANSYYNLSITYQKTGSLNKALEFMLKALIIREKLLDKNHPWIANSCNILSSLYRGISDYQKSLEFSLKEFDIRKNIRDTKPVDFAHIFKNLAISYYHLQQYQKAKTYIDQSAGIFNKALSEKNIHTVSAVNLQRTINEAFAKWN